MCGRLIAVVALAFVMGCSTKASVGQQDSARSNTCHWIHREYRNRHRNWDWHRSDDYDDYNYGPLRTHRYGATNGAWNATHTKDRNYARVTRPHGPIVETPEGPNTAVHRRDSDGNQITKFIEVLPDKTSSLRRRPL